METTKQVKMEKGAFDCEPVCSSGCISIQGMCECLCSKTKKSREEIGIVASTVAVDVLFVEAILLEHDSIFTRWDKRRQYGGGG
jgi:hypothetical protein